MTDIIARLMIGSVGKQVHAKMRFSIMVKEMSNNMKIIPMPNYNTTISNEEKLYNDKVGEQNE